VGLFIAKGVAFAALVVAAWVIIAFAGAAGVPPPLVEDAYRVADAAAPVLFMGDSSTYWPAPTDLDKRSIAGMLDAELHEHDVAELVSAGLPPVLYPALLGALLRQGCTPRMIIACANPRALSPLWDLHPFWQFPRERLYLRHDSALLRIFYQPLAVFKAFDLRPTTPAEYIEAVRNSFVEGGRKVPIIFDSPILPQHLAKSMTGADAFYASYCAPMHPDNRQILSLADLGNLAKESGVRVLFYIPPINVEAGRDLLDAGTVTQLSKRIEQMSVAAKSAGAHMLDLSNLLPAVHFTDGARTEHLDAAGRHAVAHELAVAIRAWE
jgi:hypothetical protein